MMEGSVRGAVEVQLLGRSVRLQGPVDPVQVEEAVARAEATFRAMEEAYAIHWGGPPMALDTTHWLLLGLLNQAHQLVRLEQEAHRQTQDLEQRLSRLLDDVPDDSMQGAGPLFREVDPD